MNSLMQEGRGQPALVLRLVDPRPMLDCVEPEGRDLYLGLSLGVERLVEAVKISAGVVELAAACRNPKQPLVHNYCRLGSPLQRLECDGPCLCRCLLRCARRAG